MRKQYERRPLIAGAAACAAAACAIGQDATPPFEAQTIPGLTAEDNLGFSVAGLGDVNADGREDIAAGALFADNGASGTGAAFVWFADAQGGFANPPDLTLAGLAADDQAGASLAGADLNADGANDIAVGVRFSDLGMEDAGAVFIYMGGADIDAARDHALLGEATDDWFGQSLARAGDVNADGVDDLIVGAPFNDAAGSAAGRAYIYFGADPFDETPDVVLEGARQSNAHFGWSVSGGVDVNADGFDDVLVGERLFSDGPFRAVGRAYIFFGGDPMDAEPDVVLQGQSADDWFGAAVAGAGDLDNDGFDDVLVGALFADDNGSASGNAQVFLGGDPMDDAPDATFAGPHADAQGGNSVSGAGDLNSDGFDDAIIGAHFADDAGATAVGQAFLLLGDSTIDADADAVVSGAAANEQLAESVGAGPASPVPSALIGAHQSDAGALNSGALVIAASAQAACPADLTGDGVVDGADLGTLLGAWGGDGPADLNTDGVVDGADLGALLGAWGPC